MGRFKEINMANRGIIDKSDVANKQFELNLKKEIPLVQPANSNEQAEQISPEEQKTRDKMQNYFFKELFTDSKPDEIDFEAIDKYYQDIQIQDTFHIGDDNDNFKRANIDGYLIRATINGNRYFLYTESLDTRSKVKHINIPEIRLLLNIEGEHNNNIYHIDMNKLKEVINNRLQRIANITNFQKLKERLNNRK
jgi:hypothetical protein